MKTKMFIYLPITLTAMGILLASHSIAQTSYGSGNVGNNCTLAAGTGGANSTYFGCGAGYVSGGLRNTLIGDKAGTNCGDVHDNVAVGYNALSTQQSINGQSTYNVAIGNSALLYTNATNSSNGVRNTAVGHESGFYLVVGNDNAIFGYRAGGYGASGTNSFSNNCFFGSQAGYNNKGSNDNVAVGYQALYTQSYSVTASTANTAIGYQALYSNAPSSTVTGGDNTACGSKAGYTNTTGSGNSFFGVNAAYTNNGNNNVAVGSHSLYNNSSGTKNVAVGNLSMYYKTTGDYNTAVGDNAGTGASGNTTYSYNSFFGNQSGFSTTTGGNNTFAGYQAGYTNTTGTNNTCIGKSADVSGSGQSNSSAFGNGAIAAGTNQVEIGNTNVTIVHGAVAYTWSDARIKNNVKEDVSGLAFINKLRPVTYQLDTRKAAEIVTNNLPDSIRSRHFDGVDFTPASSVTHTGLIAQEVVQAAKECNFTSDIVHIPSDTSDDTYSIAYSQIVVPLVKAVQELSKNQDSLMAVIADMKGTGQRKTGDGGTNERSMQEIKLSLLDEVSISEARPNPNNGKAEIDYYLPVTVTNAEMIFTDLLGRVINKAKLTSGYGTVAIDTEGLPNGTYTYTLVIDGKVIDTKKMIRNR